MTDINLIAVLVATLAVVVIGGACYGPLFGKAREATAGPVKEKAGQPAKLFALASVFCLIGAFAVAFAAGPAPTLMDGVLTGLGIGVAAAAGSSINYQFTAKPVSLLLMDGIYTLILLAAMGAIIGGFG